jgi:transposase
MWCGYKWGKLDLKIRSVQCLNCGTEHDRDENAAKNINKACTLASRSVGIGHCHDSKRTHRQNKTTSVASVSVRATLREAAESLSRHATRSLLPRSGTRLPRSRRIASSVSPLLQDGEYVNVG